jgi:GNAT superfamily N-acetyltransferase
MTIIRPLATADRPAWEELYQGYAAFYRVTQTPEMRAIVWDWLHDPQHESCGLVAEDAGKLIGLAHYRGFARPLSATRGMFLDDLFVDPAARGSGAAKLLLAELRSLARAKGFSVIRWITADNNYRARGLYDQMADRTGWITYDLKPH